MPSVRPRISWAPSALFYAERLIYLPQGILATALGTVLLPVLSDFAAQKKHAEMRAAVHHGLRTLLFVMTPAAVGLFVLAGPIVRMLFEHGSFDGWSSLLTARALAFYAPGLMVFCLAKVFVPAFYALRLIDENVRAPRLRDFVAEVMVELVFCFDGAGLAFQINRCHDTTLDGFCFDGQHPAGEFFEFVVMDQHSE